MYLFLTSILSACIAEVDSVSDLGAIRFSLEKLPCACVHLFVSGLFRAWVGLDACCCRLLEGMDEL